MSFLLEDIKDTPAEEVKDEDSILSQLLADEDDKEQAADTITSFVNPQAEKIDDNRRHEIEEDYGLGKIELDAFKSKIQERGNIRQNDDFTGNNDTSELDMYGLQSNFNETEEDVSKLKESEQKQYIAEQLVDMAHTIKNEYITEVATARPTSEIDPFNPSENFLEHISKTENSNEHSLSLVIEYFTKQLDELQSTFEQTQNLQAASKEHQYELETIKKLKTVVDYISRTKIIDSAVLAEIYELYRYKV